MPPFSCTELTLSPETVKKDTFAPEGTQLIFNNQIKAWRGLKGSGQTCNAQVGVKVWVTVKVSVIVGVSVTVKL